MQAERTAAPVQADSILEHARLRQDAVMRATAAQRTELPLRYLRQQAHLTAPASDRRLAEKALQSPYGVARRALDRYAIGVDDVAARLGVDVAAVESVLAQETAPAVVIDLEDGVAPSMVAEARRNAVELLRDLDRGASLGFLRTVAVTEPRCADDLVELLLDAGRGVAPARYPVDGVVVPKVRHAHEVEWVDSVLAEVEHGLGLSRNRIRVLFQIETGWGVLHLDALVAAGIGRLAGLILGTADLAADVMLPEVGYRHAVSEWARTAMVIAAGAAGVPAIDGMTLDFPVGLPGLDAELNRAHVLDRMRANFDDARHSIERGLAGRWVGHPLQLVATELAFRSAFDSSSIAGHVASVERFAGALASDRGAAAGASGELLDLGTDRHVRRLLRRATAWGLLEPSRAIELGIIETGELTGAAR